MKTQTISIIGLRRTGLSVAMALKAARPEFTIVGHDSDSRLTHEAENQHGVIDKGERNLARAAAAGDIVVLAVPASELERTLDVIGTDLQEHTLVIDLSPLKGQAMKWADTYFRQGHYVGARPVFSAKAFSDGSGDAQAARADLFQDSLFCVMPSAELEPKAVETAVKFGILLGAKPYFVDPNEYDNLVQGVDSLPGLAGAAVFKALYGAAGWRDMLRFADVPFYLMTEPLNDHADLAVQVFNDRDATLRWLDALAGEITELRRWIAEGDQDALAALLDSVNQDRETWLHERRKNDWTEVDEPRVDRMSLSQQLFGGLARRGKKDEDNS